MTHSSFTSHNLLKATGTRQHLSQFITLKYYLRFRLTTIVLSTSPTAGAVLAVAPGALTQNPNKRLKYT